MVLGMALGVLEGLRVGVSYVGCALGVMDGMFDGSSVVGALEGVAEDTPGMGPDPRDQYSPEQQKILDYINRELASRAEVPISTFEELNYAINKKILLINAESRSEIKQIEKIAKSKKKIVDIGIRLNPNTDAKTINKISTGKKKDKFGLTEKTFFELVRYTKNSKHINLKCLSVHIGSQIINNLPYEKMLKVIDKVIKKTKHKFEFVDLGGGMGIAYNNKTKKLNYKKYNIAINKFLKKNNSKIIFEPGRSIIGNTGVLISKIIYIKKTKNRDFIILDSAMNDLMRPALYGSNHQIIPVIKKGSSSKKIYEFVGPICESTDKFLTSKNFQKLKEKDLVIICDVGAYGMSLSSNYNVRPKPIEILIKDSKINIIKKRQKLIDLI